MIVKVLSGPIVTIVDVSRKTGKVMEQSFPVGELLAEGYAAFRYNFVD